MTPDCRRYSTAVGREGVPATGTDPVIRSSFEDPEGTRSSPGVIDRKPGADIGRGARLTSENTPGVFSSLQAACLGFTFLSALFGFPLENSRGRPEKALAESDRPCTELRNRNQTITIRVGMSWAAAHDCRKSPAYEGGVSMVEANRPVPLVAGDSRHRSNVKVEIRPVGSAATQQLSSNALSARRRHTVLRSTGVSSSIGLGKCGKFIPLGPSKGGAERNRPS